MSDSASAELLNTLSRPPHQGHGQVGGQPLHRHGWVQGVPAAAGVRLAGGVQDQQGPCHGQPGTVLHICLWLQAEGRTDRPIIYVEVINDSLMYRLVSKVLDDHEDELEDSMK
jgi:hypothetical protein